MVVEEREEYGVRVYHLAAPVNGPTKLFVGGLHGDEGLYTAPLLSQLVKERIPIGKAIIIPCLVENSTYIGVLSEEYYRSATGKILLRLVQKYKPAYYFELHAYGEQSYSQLTDPERVVKIGVPHFIDLGAGVLIGSIAPILRREFTYNDFCLTIEVPKWKSKSEEIKDKVLDVLRIGLTKTKREEVMHELRMRYPTEIKMAEELFYRYYRNRLHPF
jgi:hypothetical protein